MPTLLLIALAAQGIAGHPTASHDTTFWDDNWQRVNRRNAVYYGWAVPLDSGRCRILDFYLTGERQMEALGRSGPPVVKDGPATYYYRSGVKKAAGQFVNGKHEGVWSYWQQDGTPRQQRLWQAGVIKHPVEPAKKFTTVIVPYIPQIVEQMPRLLGSLSLNQYLTATTRRPPGPLPGNAAEGKVYVEFVVNAEGTVASVRLVKGFAPAYDAEALRAVAALPRWEPGRQHGQPVAVRMTIPITFR